MKLSEITAESVRTLRTSELILLANPTIAYDAALLECGRGDEGSAMVLRVLDLVGAEIDRRIPITTERRG